MSIGNFAINQSISPAVFKAIPENSFSGVRVRNNNSLQSNFSITNRINDVLAARQSSLLSSQKTSAAVLPTPVALQFEPSANIKNTIGQGRDPLAVAQNIVDPVINKLNQAQAQGATTESLNNILSLGRSGIEAGIEQALADLQDSGLLTDQLRQEISNTQELVNQRLDQLSQQLNQSTPELVATSNFSSISNQFAFSLTTQEGDRVEISFQTAEIAFEKKSAAGELAFSKEQSRFQIKVDGNLDADERQAIDTLFDQIQSLSAQFFQGDTQQAVEQALSLGVNFDEIASLSLKLSQTQVSRVREAYRLPPSPLGQLAGQAKQTIAAADGLATKFNAANASDLISSILDKIPFSKILNRDLDPKASVDNRPILDRLVNLVDQNLIR